MGGKEREKKVREIRKMEEKISELQDKLKEGTTPSRSQNSTPEMKFSVESEFEVKNREI